MDEKRIRIIPFAGEKDKWRMWSGNFMERSGIKVYNVLLTGDNKNPADDADKTKEKLVSYLKFLNKTAYNEFILAQ